MKDITITLGPDEVSYLRLYLDLCEMYYRGRGTPGAEASEKRFADEHIGIISEMRQKLKGRSDSYGKEFGYQGFAVPRGRATGRLPGAKDKG